MSLICNAQKCDICSTPFNEGDFIYDFRLRGRTYWATGCDSCFKAYGDRLGIGHGQKFLRGKPEPIEGGYGQDS